MFNYLNTKHSFTLTEQKLIHSLNTPEKVQKYLNDLPYNYEKKGETIVSFRGIVERKRAHCLEAVFFAAAILNEHGYPPLLLDLSSVDQLDHCLFLYQEKKRGLFGTVGISRERELYGKPAQFESVYQLVISYFDDYIDTTACVDGYAVVDLDTIPRANWRFSKRNLWSAERYLIDIEHTPVRRSRRHIIKMRLAYLERQRMLDAVVA